MTATTTAYLPDGRYVEVPEDSARDWRYEVNNKDTQRSLADWYLEYEENGAQIKGEPEDDPRCEHEGKSHRVTNQSQTGEYQDDKPMSSARVCGRRACLLDAMAWVERGTGEPAAWQAPDREFSFAMPEFSAS